MLLHTCQLSVSVSVARGCTQSAASCCRRGARAGTAETNLLEMARDRSLWMRLRILTSRRWNHKIRLTSRSHFCKLQLRSKSSFSEVHSAPRPISVVEGHFAPNQTNKPHQQTLLESIPDLTMEGRQQSAALTNVHCQQVSKACRGGCGAGAPGQAGVLNRLLHCLFGRAECVCHFRRLFGSPAPGQAHADIHEAGASVSIDCSPPPPLPPAASATVSATCKQ